jgi:hypothetical protein
MRQIISLTFLKTKRHTVELLYRAVARDQIS